MQITGQDPTATENSCWQSISHSHLAKSQCNKWTREASDIFTKKTQDLCATKRDLDSESDIYFKYMLLDAFNGYRVNVQMRIVLLLAVSFTWHGIETQALFTGTLKPTTRHCLSLFTHCAEGSIKSSFSTLTLVLYVTQARKSSFT